MQRNNERVTCRQRKIRGLQACIGPWNRIMGMQKAKRVTGMKRTNKMVTGLQRTSKRVTCMQRTKKRIQACRWPIKGAGIHSY